MSLLDRWRVRQITADNTTTITERISTMTSETELPTTGAKPHQAGGDAYKLRAALHAVDRLSLTTLTFPHAREWFGRADQLAAELEAMRAADEATRTELIEALADGSVPANEAAVRALELARADTGPQRGPEPGHALVTAAADLAANRALAAARDGEAAEAMTMLRAEGERVAHSAAVLPVPLSGLAAFGYTSREAETWDQLMQLLERWEAICAAAVAVRRAVNRDAVEQLVAGMGGTHQAVPVPGWAKVAPDGWELPPLESEHVLIRASIERQLRAQAAQERAAEQAREEANAAYAKSQKGGIRPGMPGSNSFPPLGMW
ncbi:hypothetical protein [Kribbella sp. NPDC051137]|uniref:hypothetical protein n=1 Tax=Kribbella sp. NPDC051137 TaxID=3155045 RepID=UPI0034437C04